MFTILLLLCCVVNISSQSPQSTQSSQSLPQLRISPAIDSQSSPSLSVSALSPFVLTCSGVNSQPQLFADFKWFDSRNEQITDEYSRRRGGELRTEELSVGQLLLHFARPTPDDSGQYTCRATFQRVDALEATRVVTFFEDVHWDDCPEVQSIIEGQYGERIRCRASANPKPLIMWTKDGQTLATDTNANTHSNSNSQTNSNYNSNSRYSIDAEGVKVNANANMSDGGQYRVRALVTETGRVHHKHITVTVLVRPQFIESLSPSHFDAIEDEQTQLKCVANGRPPPLYSWFDQRKRNLSEVGGYIVDRNEGTVLIGRVNRYDDNGTFICLAENWAGRATRQTEVTVVVKAKVDRFDNLTVDSGDEIVMECKAIGYPRPQIEIRKDGNSRPFVVGDPRVTLDVRFENEMMTILVLRMGSTVRTDDGLYYCNAHNSGARSERVGHVEVRFAPDLRRTPTTNVKTWNDNDKVINISCIVDAIPNATVKWWHRGIEIVTVNGAMSELYTIEDDSWTGMSRLKIRPNWARGSSHSDIYGTYRCEATNAMGRNAIDIQLERAYRPSHILRTHYDRVSATSVTLRLSGPANDGGMPIKAIHLQYREDVPTAELRTKTWPVVGIVGGSGQLSASVSGADHGPYLLDGLRPRTRYHLRFAAENEVGVGDFSVDQLLTTLSESRPNRPEFHNLPFDADSKEFVSPFGDKFALMWTVPEDNGRQIKYFEVKYYEVERSVNGYEVAKGAKQRKVERVTTHDYNLGVYNDRNEMSMSTGAITLTALEENRYYRVELSAYNDLGYSDAAVIVFKTAKINSAYDGDFTVYTADNTQTKTQLATIIGISVVCVVVLLIAMDVIFYYRYKTGIIYFMRVNVCDMSVMSDNRHVRRNDNEDNYEDNDDNYDESERRVKREKTTQQTTQTKHKIQQNANKFNDKINEEMNKRILMRQSKDSQV